MKAEDLLSQLDWLRALALQIARDPELAEDVAQDACVIALQRSPDDLQRLRSWLARIVRNLVSQRVRGEGRRRERELSRHVAASCEEPELLIERVALQRELASWVLKLEEPHRSTLLLRFYGGLTLREIARHQGVSVAVVHERLQRTLASLRRRLDRSAGGVAVWSAVLFGSPVRIGTLAPTSIGSLIVNAKIVGAVALVLAATLVAVKVLQGTRTDAESSPLAAAPKDPALVDVPVPPQAPAESDANDRTNVAVPTVEPATTPLEEVKSQPASILEDRERLERAVEASLRGDLDASAILDLGLALVHLEADPRAIPEPNVSGTIQFPIEGTPAGLKAMLEVGRTSHGEKVLNLRLVLEESSAPRVYEGAARLPADIQIYSRGDAQGRLSSFSFLTQSQVHGPATRGAGLSLEGRMPTALHYVFRPEDPLHPIVNLSGADKGQLFEEDLTSWRTVGGPWPRLEDMQCFYEQLQAMYAKVAQ